MRVLKQSGPPCRVRPTASGNFALGTANRVAHVANGLNQGRFAQLFSESANEHFNQLGIVFVRMLPNPFAQLRACEDASRFPHEHLQQHQFARRKFDSLRVAMNVMR